jgi:hypothetical protein
MPRVIAGVVDLERHLFTDNAFKGNGMVFREEIG